MRLVLFLLLSSLASAQGMGGKSGIGGKAGFGGGSAAALAFVDVITPTTGASNTTFTLTVASAVTAPAEVHVVIGENTSTADTIAVHDSKGNCANVYSVNSQQDVPNLRGHYIASCAITTSLAPGDTFTVTDTNNTVNYSFIVVATTGVTSGLDNIQVRNQDSNSTTFTSATYTPGHSTEIVYVCGSSGTTWSANGNVIAIAATGGDHVGSAGNVEMCEYRAISVTTAGTGTFTLTGADGGPIAIFGDF